MEGETFYTYYVAIAQQSTKLQATKRRGELITHSEGNQPGEHILDRSNLSRYILFIPAAGSGAHVNLVFRPEQETAGRAFRACIFAVIGWLAGYSIRSRLLVNESSADASLRCRGQFRSRSILDLTHLFDQAQ